MTECELVSRVVIQNWIALVLDSADVFREESPVQPTIRQRYSCSRRKAKGVRRNSLTLPFYLLQYSPCQNVHHPLIPTFLFDNAYGRYTLCMMINQNQA